MSLFLASTIGSFKGANMALEGNHGYWGDLHRPDLTPKQADFSIIGIPYDGLASARKGAAQAPERLRYWSRHLTPFSEDRTRLKDGDDPAADSHQQAKWLSE